MLVWDLFCDFELLKSMSSELDNKNSHIADEALAVCTRLCDILISSGQRVTEEEI